MIEDSWIRCQWWKGLKKLFYGNRRLIRSWTTEKYVGDRDRWMTWSRWEVEVAKELIDLAPKVDIKRSRGISGHLFGRVDLRVHLHGVILRHLLVFYNPMATDPGHEWRNVRRWWLGKLMLSLRSRLNEVTIHQRKFKSSKHDPFTEFETAPLQISQRTRLRKFFFYLRNYNKWPLSCFVSFAFSAIYPV